MKEPELVERLHTCKKIGIEQCDDMFPSAKIWVNLKEKRYMYPVGNFEEEPREELVLVVNSNWSVMDEKTQFFLEASLVC